MDTLLWLIAFVAWINHVIWCLEIHDIPFLMIGTIIPPIGVIHGIWLWF